MAERHQIVSQTTLQVDGEHLDEAVNGQIIEITVDQHAHLPAMFTIRLHDPGLKLLDGGPFNLASKIEITSKTAGNQSIKLITGEVTALEPAFGEGMIAELTIRGYDQSHRLYRERKSKTYLNVKDSDLAAQIAKAVDLTAEVDATKTVYAHLYQHNQSDLEFLRYRAQRIGYECFVQDGKLFFRKSVTKQATVTIAWGNELIIFRPRLTLSEQVEEVWVKGWDVQKKTAIIGRADHGNRYARTKEKKDGKAWSQALGQLSRMVIVDQLITSQAEADIVAAARLDELSGAFVEAEGEVFRRPDVQAGQWIKIEGLGKRLSGEYMVTRAMHVYTSAGLQTYFTVSGARTGLLLEQLRHEGTTQPQFGIVPAIVTNTDDPEGWGRVKVKYPWLSDQEESYWARVLSLGAGPNCGLTIIPAVDDEVMVVFQQGDFDHPVVLGGMWNGVDAVPAPISSAAAGEKPLVRSWMSRTGHHMTIYDNADNKVELVTNGGHSLTLDDAGKTITIQSAGGLEIVMDDNGQKIVVKSGGDIEVTAANGLTMKGTNVKFEASGTMDLQASGPVNVKGATINLN